MAGLSTELLLDIADFAKALQSAVAQSRSAVAQIRSAMTDGANGFNAAAQAASRVGGNMTQAAGRASQLATAVRRTAAAAAGVAAIGAAAVALNRRFPQVAASAVAAFARIRAGAATAARSAGPVSVSLVRIAGRAAAVATAVQTVATAYRFLFGNAKQANSEMAKTKGPSGGAGGGGGVRNSILAGVAGGAIGGPIGSAIVAGIKGAATRIRSAFLAPLNAAADEETLKVSLGVLVGDQGKTDALLADLQKRAADTPLEFGELAEGASMLIAFGESADGVGDTLQRIGDVAAGVRAPLGQITEIYGKARVQNQLFAEDINQLTGRGIPVIGEFAKQLGVSESEVKKLASEGQITFPMLEKAFVSLTREGGKFNGMLSKQADTVKGKLSTLADAIQMNWKAFGAPINDALKPLLDIAIEKVEALRGRAAEIGAAMATGLRQIVAAIGVIASMPMAEIGKVLGAALRVGAVSAINVLYRGLRATMAAAGQYFIEYIRAAVALISLLSKGEFWSGMDSALTGVAKLFAATVLDGITNAIAWIKEAIKAALVGDGAEASDKLASRADKLRAEGEAGLSGKGFDFAALFEGADGGLRDALSRIAGAFQSTFAETGDILTVPEGSSQLLSDFLGRLKDAMAAAKDAAAKATGTGGAGGTGDGSTGKGKGGLPAIAGRLAGSMNMITGKSYGEVLQKEGNALLQQIADNTSKDTKPQPKVVSPAARAVGVFS